MISNFRRVLNVVCFLLDNSPASKFYTPTFRNTLSVPYSQADRCRNSTPIRLWKWNRQSIPERRHIKLRRPGKLPRRKHTTLPLLTLIICSTDVWRWSFCFPLNQLRNTIFTPYQCSLVFCNIIPPSIFGSKFYSSWPHLNFIQWHWRSLHSPPTDMRPASSHVVFNETNNALALRLLVATANFMLNWRVKRTSVWPLDARGTGQGQVITRGLMSIDMSINYRQNCSLGI